LQEAADRRAFFSWWRHSTLTIHSTKSQVNKGFAIIDNIPSGSIFLTGITFALRTKKGNEMSGQNTAVLVYAIPTAVTRAIGRLQDSECEIRFSVVAREQREESLDESIRDDFWYRLWSPLPDRAVFSIPETGPLLIAGPMSGLMVSVLNNVSMFNGLNALEACLHSIGVPGEKIRAYEAAVQAGGILLLVHGTAQEVERARGILVNA
jgi:hypothetical protein